ncbi:MAG TPA: hypothetical protein VF596_19830 [Pyrinomonadaceae bacterium]|jgi:hypothetical protein
MSKCALFSRLCFELKTAAHNYKSEILDLDAPDTIFMLKLLTNRCEKFVSEIEQAIGTETECFLLGNEILLDGKSTEAANTKAKNFSQIFERLEKSESRLERLYRRILQNSEITGELRNLLERQSLAVYNWHNFVINEEINFILVGEVKVPSEFQEKFYYGSIS